MLVTWSDEKLILLYSPGRGSNSRRSAHRSFKHDQGVPRPLPLGHGGDFHLHIPVAQYSKESLPVHQFIHASLTMCIIYFTMSPVSVTLDPKHLEW